MLKKTKKLVFALSFLSLAVCAGAGFNALNDMTASAQTANASDLYITAGASVRTDEKVEGNEVVGYDTGIRFTANASASLIESLVETTGDTVTYKTGAELGMFIVPQSYINDYSSQSEYTDYFDYFANVKKKSKAQIAYACNAEDLDAVNGTKYRVAIMELLEKNYNRAYQSVAYYTLDGETYYYTVPEVSNSRTISQVIDSALQATDVPFQAGQKTAMAGILERALELKMNGDYTVAVHGDKAVDLKARFASNITAPDLTFTVTDGETAVEVDNNGVATALPGDSTAKVKVTAYGGLVDFDVTVKTLEEDATEVIDFAGANDLETAKVVSEGSATTISYLDSFEGATGVAKMTATGAWGHFGFQPVNDMTTYADSYYIVFRMYIANGFAGSFWLGGGNNCLTAVETGKWVDYYFPAQVFQKQWANCATNYYVGNMALVASKAGEFYVDEIYTVANVELASNEVNSFSDELQIKSTVAQDSTITWQDGYQGATGVVKVTAPFTGDRWGYFGFKPLQDMSVYADSDFIVFRMYIVSMSGNFWLGNGFNCKTTVTTGQWKDYYFPAKAFIDCWTKNSQGNEWTVGYEIGAMSLSASAGYELYIDEIYTTSVTPATGNEVLTFAEKAQMGYTVELDSTITWQYSYEGATGVAKMTSTGGWGHFGFKPMQDMSVYADCNYIVFRMYIVKAPSAFWFAQGNNNCLNKEDITTEKWIDCYFDGALFKTNWANSTTAYDVYSMALVASSSCEIYIDEVFVTNEMPA